MKCFTEELKFSDLTKLLEVLSISKFPKKRDGYVRDYFEKLHKFREAFRKKNIDWVSES